MNRDFAEKLKEKVGENNKIFGGTTSKEISETLKKEYEIEIDKKKITIKETIKNLGRYTADIKFGDGVNAELTINITAE